VDTNYFRHKLLLKPQTSGNTRNISGLVESSDSLASESSPRKDGAVGQFRTDMYFPVENEGDNPVAQPVQNTNITGFDVSSSCLDDYRDHQDHSDQKRESRLRLLLGSKYSDTYNAMAELEKVDEGAWKAEEQNPAWETEQEPAWEAESV
jgi:hypothetical protein